jgi:hypothetical protein
VEKIIIDQESLRRFVNVISPGAYISLTKIDFRTLDNAGVKPVGVYGSKERIVDLLLEIGAIEPNLSVFLPLQSWLSHIADFPTAWMHFLQAKTTP